MIPPADEKAEAKETKWNILEGGGESGGGDAPQGVWLEGWPNPSLSWGHAKAKIQWKLTPA